MDQSLVVCYDESECTFRAIVIRGLMQSMMLDYMNIGKIELFHEGEVWYTITVSRAIYSHSGISKTNEGRMKFVLYKFYEYNRECGCVSLSENGIEIEIDGENSILSDPKQNVITVVLDLLEKTRTDIDRMEMEFSPAEIHAKSPLIISHVLQAS